MKQSDLKINSLRSYPVLLLEALMPHSLRHSIFSLNKYLAWLFVILLVLAKLGGLPSIYSVRILGLLLMSLSLAFVIFLLESFFRSYFSFVSTEELEAGRILYLSKNSGLTRAVFCSDFGKLLSRRLELRDLDIAKFFSLRRKEAYDYELPDFSGDSFLNQGGLLSSILKQDEDLKNFLLQHNITEKDFLKTAEWIINSEKLDEEKERWWSRENLSKIKAIGKTWAFGRTLHLDQVSNDLTSYKELFSDSSERSFRDDLVSEMENIFAKSSSANILLVGDPGAGQSGLILDFVRKISNGQVGPWLAYSRVLELDTNAIVAGSKNKSEFENSFLSLLGEALYAGDIILVIGDFPSFVTSARALGSDVDSLLSKFLEANLQVIATSDVAKFHAVLEPDLALMNQFEKISIDEPNEDKTLEILENFINDLEQRNKIFFSYAAVTTVMRSAENYFVTGIMPGKAIDLAREISAVHGQGSIIDKDAVLDFVAKKTKMPVGKISGTEKDVLLNLESELHKRIIGQNEAIDAISKAMRRARVGVRDPKKPIGSFLFLGPTGVGKTETAKALSQIFFGDEKYMLRLDMSEYQTEDSLSKLIGDFKLEKPGVLSDMLRDKPYGVLLLDEFEKSAKGVLNLFLQILDEGFFSDMNGTKVSTKNIIFIATSNAASEMIFDLTEKGSDLVDSRDQIINKIISDGIYKPELINRFDDVIIFHPLNQDELKQIASLMLAKLARRLSEQGVTLVINTQMIEKVLAAGYNKTFGARPMNRAIGELIEEPIARRLIEGSLVPGGKFEM